MIRVLLAAALAIAPLSALGRPRLEKCIQRASQNPELQQSEPRSLGYNKAARAWAKKRQAFIDQCVERHKND
jgi:hypothetical protein